jgi:acyl carrier protein
MEDIQTTLANFIVKDILKQPKRVLQPSEALISNGLIDSFSLVDIALFVEKSFGVKIDDTELNADFFDSLEALTTLIKQRIM